MRKAAASKLVANDILAIHQLHARFALAFDDLLPDSAVEWASTFTPGGTFELRDSGGAVQKKAQGTKELMALHSELANSAIRHWYGNLLIDPQPGGARMRCYLISLDTKNLAVKRTAVYRDTLVKTKGRWKFKAREVTLDIGSS